METDRDPANTEPEKNPATVRWALFAFNGRISRATYILGQLFMLSILVVIVVLIVQTPESNPRFVLWGLVFILVGFAAFWSVIALSVKRLHDLGWPTALVLALFVPFASPVMIIILAVMPGMQQENEFGPAPFGKSK